MEDFVSPPQSSSEGGRGVVFLYLSLYLLILSFFLLLISISTFEESKQKAAIGSVTATFANIVPPATEITASPSEEGGGLTGQAFQEEITGLFATSLRIAKVAIVQPGQLMHVQIPTDAVFFDSKAEIRPAQSPLLDRIVASLNQRPPGLRHDMEFVIGSPYVGDKSLPIGQTLEMARAGVVARELSARGAPPDSISIGIKAGDPDEINIWFYTRSIEETRLKFKTAAPSKDDAVNKSESGKSVP